MLINVTIYSPYKEVTLGCVALLCEATRAWTEIQLPLSHHNDTSGVTKGT